MFLIFMCFRLLVLLWSLCGSVESAWGVVDAFNQSFGADEDEMLRKQRMVRLKDIVSVEGVRSNVLMGYGLVVGLEGTGDNVRNVVFAKKELENLLSQLGINANGAELKTKNLAAVMVTGSLPPFARSGNYLDVKVSALGDAKSLEGGMLLATSMKGADGQVYALAQGEVTIPGVPPKRQGFPGAGVFSYKGVKTLGQVTNGAIVEREVDFELGTLDSVKLSLVNSDVSTAHRIADAINERVYLGIAKALDPHTVELAVPDLYRNNVLGLLADIEQLEILPDLSAKIIVDENTGAVVIGEKVKVYPIAISHSDLSLSIQENLALIDGNRDLRVLVDSINRLGLPQKDLIEILQVIKESGALQGDLIVR